MDLVDVGWISFNFLQNYAFDKLKHSKVPSFYHENSNEKCAQLGGKTTLAQAKQIRVRLDIIHTYKS